MENKRKENRRKSVAQTLNEAVTKIQAVKAKRKAIDTQSEIARHAESKEENNEFEVKRFPW